MNKLNINYPDDEKLKKLTEKQKDILRELGNIGSGNAIVALSDLLNRTIEMSLTSIDIVPFWKIPYLFGDDKMEVFGIYSKIEGENDFRVLQIYSKESVINMINTLTDFEKIKVDEIKVVHDLDDFSKSIILEVGNILTGHYTSALANLLSISLIPDVPELALENIAAITNCIIVAYCQKSDFAIVIETTMRIEDLKLKGILCFIPSIETVDKFLNTITSKFNI
ncbi:MAG: chemotaxis protein CheC [Promethearchaeota archaeon]